MPILLNNRYQLEVPQASGGMATVYRAVDLMLERTVAVKVLRADLSEDPEFRDRFRQEAKAAANLSHPNIVTVHDFGLDAGRLFIVMEYVPGIDLKSIIKNRGRLPIQEALALITQACRGIGYAHRAGIVHCDIKPQNMLVTPDQHLKVFDFGIARAFASISPDETNEIVWGSPQYFSPEQASGKPPSPASDVYSLGVVLFELLTGQLPFVGATAEDLARQQRELPPPSPSKLNPEIPEALERIVLKVLSKEPSARYRTADQMAHVLANLNQQSSAGLLPIHTDQAAPTIGQQTVSQVPYYPNNEPAVSLPGSQPGPLAGTFERSDGLNIDWLTWLLAFITFIALGGLIPFWLWVYSILNPPIK